MTIQAPPLVAPKDDQRATAGIRRAKSWCGLIGFGLAGFSAYAHGDVLFDVGVRALVGGVAGWLVGWAVAVTVWRRILKAETHRAVEIMRTQTDARAAASAAATAAAAMETAEP